MLTRNMAQNKLGRWLVVRDSQAKEAGLLMGDCYFRENRSKSAICEAISSRAASAAERIP